MIQNIVFDMGNVLVDYDPEKALKRFCGDDDGDCRLLRREIFRSVEWVLCDRGAITHADMLPRLRRRLPERLWACAGEILNRWHETMSPIPETNRLALRLKEAGYGLYLLSNASVSFYGYCDTIPAIPRFDGLFISAEWGLLKPDPAIYHAFCGHFSLVPARCLFIDDLPGNVEGAIRAGMGGVVFHGDAGDLETDLRDAGIRI